MFNASKGYGAAFDGDIWKPEGMPDAVGSDQGLDGFVTNPLKAREMETRFAGDALMNYAGVKDVKYMADKQVEASAIRKELMEKSQKSSGSGGGGFGGSGKIAGGISGSVVGGRVGGAIGSGLRGGLGRLFG